MVPEENVILMLSRNLLSHRFLYVLRLRVNYLCVFERFISCIVRLWLVFELMFFPVKLYTYTLLRLIFLFIVSLFVSFRYLKYIFLLMFGTVSLSMF